MSKIYFSVPMEFCPDPQLLKLRLTRVQITLEELGHTVYNPYIEEPIIIKELADSLCNDMVELKNKYPDRHKALMKELRKLDCKLISEYDIVLAFPSDVVSGGLAGEVTLAAFLGKRVLFFFEQTHHEVAQSSWVKSCADETYNNIELDTILTAISKVS